MEKQALANPESFVQSLWSSLGEPKLRKWVQSQGMELGPWQPHGNLADHLDEQRFADIQNEIMRSATSGDPTIIKILKGFNTMLGGEWGPGQQQQAESIRGSIVPIAPILMRWAPEWWDEMHGGTGSVASLASAIADAHRYDDRMTSEKAVQMAEEMAQDLLSDPMKHRGFSLREIGGAYREAAGRGWVGRGNDIATQTNDLTSVLGPVSAIRDVMGPAGYDTSDISGMFGALDTIVPNAHYNFGQADTDIRIGRYFAQRGGLFGNAMDMAGVTIPPGGASRDELSRQHAQLTRQAGESEIGNMMLATARAADAGMITPGSEAQSFLDKAMAGELKEFNSHDWQQMMARSGIRGAVPSQLAAQHGENQMFLQRNPQYRNLVNTVRANQTQFDHQRQFNILDQQYAGMHPEVGRGAKSEYLRGKGYDGMKHYGQLHGPAANQIAGVMGQAGNRARVEQNMAHMGWKGPVQRGMDEVKRGTKNPIEFGGAVLGGIRTEPIKMAAATVAVDLDGTLAKMYEKFDSKVVGDPRPGAKDAMQKFRDKGYTVIINTVRGDISVVKEWLQKHEICYDHINENPNQPEDASDKLIADVYIDDRGVDARPSWRKIVEKVVPRLARKKQASMTIKQAARGVPDPRFYGDPSKLGVGKLVDLFVQRHKAQRAGEHFDYRIGTPVTGLLSWSTKPTRLPAPGEKRFVRQQPVHAHRYGMFQGTIGSGYGKGEVRRERRGKVLVTKATPDKIEYTMATTGIPERFVLMRPEKWGEREWLLINVTPKASVPYEKVRYRKLLPEEVEPYIDQMQAGTSVQAKLDGAASLIKLMRGGAEVLSYRVSKRTGHPIVHTERMFGGRPKLDIPRKYEGTVLKGELYAQPNGNGRVPTGADDRRTVLPDIDRVAGASVEGERPVGPQALGGILNATIEHSLEKQKKRGLGVRSMIYDIQQLGKRKIDPETTTYAERRKLLEEVMPFLPADKFHISEEATNPEDAKALWRDVIEGRHPLTHEGIVIHPPTGRPFKAKPVEESDVHITDIFPGKHKYEGTAAGGFGYSLVPGGPRVGEVGTGLSDELRRQLYKDQDAFIGRVARIRSQEQHPSGAWRAPSLIALHEDYPLK